MPDGHWEPIEEMEQEEMSDSIFEAGIKKPSRTPKKSREESGSY